MSHNPKPILNNCNFHVLFLSTSFIMASISLSVGFIPNTAAAFINSRRDNLPSPFKSILWKDSFISKMIKKIYNIFKNFELSWLKFFYRQKILRIVLLKVKMLLYSRQTSSSNFRDLGFDCLQMLRHKILQIIFFPLTLRLLIC